MPRIIPIDLLQDLRRGATTMCVLVKVAPVRPGFAAYGVTNLNRDVDYDDGTGLMTYVAAVGVEMSSQVYGADLSVDGGEASSLLPVFDTPVSEADIVAGAYDFARFRAYQIDYTKPTPGRHIIVGNGTTGRNTVIDGGLAYSQELRGLAQALLQTITEKWSLGCRATPGSQYLGTATEEVTERYPCNWDRSALWEAFAVIAPGAESNQLFTTSGLAPAFGGAPASIKWTSGRNAGQSSEVEAFTDVGGVQTVELAFPTMFPVGAGDEGMFVDSCPGTADACKARGNWQHYRGEPNIPVADAGQIASPGASAGVGTGAAVNQDFTETV